MKKTLRLHLENPYLMACDAVVTGIDLEKGIILNQTVAFAEGGGQEGDRGYFILDNGNTVEFLDTQKGYGRPLLLNDFPAIQVDTPVYHKIAAEDLDKFGIGQPLRVFIDINRRAKLTISHSGIHAVLMGLERVKPDLYGRIRGCHIKEEGARLDFFLSNDDKFLEREVEEARDFTNQIINENWSAQWFAHAKEPEAMYWKCGNTVYACGGTHLPSLGTISQVSTSKKNLGASMQRVSFTFPNAKLPLEIFHS